MTGIFFRFQNNGMCFFVNKQYAALGACHNLILVARMGVTLVNPCLETFGWKAFFICLKHPENFVVFSVKMRQTDRSGNPGVSVRIFKKIMNLYRRKLMRMAGKWVVICKNIQHRIIDGKAIIGANPKQGVAAFINTIDQVLQKRPGIVGIMPEHLHCMAIKPG